jgi:CHAD domain-containing protein
LNAKDSLRSVARSRRFQQALGKRLTVLDRDLPAVLEHDAEALHRTRVASRRLREVLPVIEAPAGVQPRRGNRGRVRRLTRALGGVRDLDVALVLLDELAAGHPHAAPLAAAVRDELHRDRAVRYAEMIRSLADIKPGRLTRDLASLVETPHAPTGAQQHRRLRDRVFRRAARLNRAVDEAGSLYAFDRLHRVRIAAKKLRYVLELVQELTRVGTTRLVTRLKETQDLLGRLHDLEILAGYVRRVRGLPPPRRPSGGRAGLIEAIEKETRELHAEYLHRASTLRAVTAACREDVGHRLR